MPTEQTNIIPGAIVEGKVQGITKFGAFIELPGGEVGLVHISEIADTYVKDVKDFIKEGDTVKVKILSVAGKKIGLSMKQTVPRKPEMRRQSRPVNKPNISLDDKIAKFLKESDERMQPLKNRLEPKRRNRTSQ
ncbi:MAG: S1 RNA-binding domain-containing protein [Syntrophomonadaceae bacterium]|nr:S1 RNA-binding domain-containing protein [Syntrophomonadaceae bacterium]MDD3889663.1 S1 RNA-binding domain-containing protein [Syntrophomonadaceae bacterium]MDD4548939.1 S1 RNA-binding domain-containing protein [Syntrophomonadaceae bacterium]